MARSTYRSQDIDALVRRQQEQEEKRRRRSGYTADDVRSMLGDVPYAAPEQERWETTEPATQHTRSGYTADDVRSMLGDVPYAAPEQERWETAEPTTQHTSSGYTADDVRSMLGDATPGGAAATTGRVDMDSQATAESAARAGRLNVRDWWREKNDPTGESGTGVPYRDGTGTRAAAAPIATAPVQKPATADDDAVSDESIGRGVFGYLSDQREYNKKLKELQKQAEALRKDPKASGQEKAAKDAEINALLREWQRQISPAGTLQNTAERIGEDLRGVGEQWVGSLRTFGQAATDPKVLHDVGNDYLAGQYAMQAAQAMSEGHKEYADLNEELMRAASADKISDVYTAENSPGVALQQRGQRRIERALEGVEGPARFAADVANSMAENAPGMAAALIPVVGPAASMGMLGAQATGGRMAELSNEGMRAGEAFERGVLSGAIEVGTEVIPVGNWADIVQTGAGKDFIRKAMGEIVENGGKAAMSGAERTVRNILSQALSEGTEEAVSYIANYVVDAAAADPNAEFSLKELIENAAMGAASGAGFGALGTGINAAGRAFGGRQAAENTAAQQETADAGDAKLREQMRSRPAEEAVPGEAADADAAQTVERAAAGDPAAMREALDTYEQQRAAQAAAAGDQEVVPPNMARVRAPADIGTGSLSAPPVSAASEARAPDMVRQAENQRTAPEPVAAVADTVTTAEQQSPQSEAEAAQAAEAGNQEVVPPNMARVRAPADIGTGSLNAPPVSAASEARAPDMVRQAETPEEAVRADPRFAADEGVRLTAAQQRLFDAGTETLGMTGQAAQRMATSWDGRTDAAAYASGWQSLYRAGQLGLAENSEQAVRLAGEQAATLDEYAQRLAFGQGAAEGAVYPFSQRAQNVQAVTEAADADTHYTDAMREAVKSGYKGQSPTVYMQAVNGMYDAGRTGSLTYEQALRANRTAAMAVDDAELLRGVYDLGAASVQGQGVAARTLGTAERGGTVQYGESVARGSTQVPAEVLDAFAKKFDVDIDVVRELTDGDGQKVNGHFAAGLARVTLGENSRNGFQSLAHEFVHYFSTVNPEGWAKLKNALLGFYTSERGMGAAQRVLDRYAESYGSTVLGADELATELFAGILSEESNMRSLLEYVGEDETLAPAEKRSIFKTLRDLLDKVIEHLQGLLRGGDATIGTAEGRRLAERAETAERCRELVNEFLQDLETGRQNNARRTEARRGGVQQNTAQEHAAARENVRASKNPGAAQSSQYPQGQYSGKAQVSYNTLISMPDMQVTQLAQSSVQGMKAGAIITQGMNGLTAVPGRKAVAVRNRYTGYDIAITRTGLKHGLHDTNKLERNGPYVLKIGQILENAIKVNELPGRGNYKRADVYLGVAQLPADNTGKSQGQYVVRMIVEVFPNGQQQLGTIEAGLLYAHTGEKSSAPSGGARASGAITLPGPQGGNAAVGQNTAIQGRSSGNSPISVSGSATISIADFLQTVNNLKGDIMPGALSQDVKTHLGRQAKGDLGGDVLYSRPVVGDDGRGYYNENGLWNYAPIRTRIDELEAEVDKLMGRYKNNGWISNYGARLYNALDRVEKTIDAEFATLEANPTEGDKRELYTARRRVRQLRQRITESQNGPKLRTEADARFEEAYRRMLEEDDDLEAEEEYDYDEEPEEAGTEAAAETGTDAAADTDERAPDELSFGELQQEVRRVSEELDAVLQEQEDYENSDEVKALMREQDSIKGNLEKARWANQNPQYQAYRQKANEYSRRAMDLRWRRTQLQEAIQDRFQRGQQYSRSVDGESDSEARTRLERENRDLAWRVSNMEEQLQRVRAEMKLSEGHTFSRNAIRGVASRILNEYESRYDRATLENELENIFAHIAEGGPDASYQEAMETCTNLMKDVIKQSSRVNTELRDYYRPVREALRGQTIEVKEGSPIYYDILDAFGDGENGKKWGNVRRATFGRINLRLVQGAGNADTFFAELAEQYPAVFDADAHPVDNIWAALNVFEASQPVYENPYGLDIDSAAAFAGQELFEAYMMTPEHHTYADRRKQKMLRLRGEMMQRRKDAMERQKASYEKKLAKLRKTNAQRIQKNRDRMQKRMDAQQRANTRRIQDVRTEMRQQMEERGQRAAQAAREQRQAAVNRVRSEMTDRMLKQRAIYEQRMERRNEGMRWRQARDGVQKSVRRLQRWLQNPTDQAHVPERMRKAVLDLLTSFDWNTSNAGTRAARDWRMAMKDIQLLALEMDSRNGADDLKYIDFDPDLKAEIDELIEAGKGAGQIHALNAAQMQQLRGVLESVTRSITEANKLMAGEQMRDLQDVAEGSIMEMEQAKGQQLRAKNKLVAAVTDTAVAERVSQLLGPDMMDAGYYFRTLGPKAESVYRNIRAGFDKRVWHLREAQEKMAEILKGHDVKEWTGPKAKARDFEVGGVHIKLTPGQIMELYCLTQREQAKEHLLQGGITVDEPGGKRRGPRVRLTPETLAEIVGTLTPEQVKMAQRMQAYLSTDVASWGNEVSMKQYGVRKFNEPHYWPIKSNQNFTRTSDATVNDAGLWGIKNKGMTKATVKGANNPIILHDAFDTWTGHVAEMATYNAWCIPLSDAMKWYNYRGQNEISVKEAIEDLYGKKGQNFFVQLIKDINGTDSRGGGTFADTWGTLQSRWKVAKVGANLRVAVQQPTAYFRAGAVLSPKYLAGALVKAPVEVRRGMREALQYCAIAQWKNWGYFETNIGQSMRSILTGEQTAAEWIQDKSTALAELGDSVTWGTLWLACEDDVRDRRPELDRGSEAFKEAVAERLSEVIDRTQVVDTVLHRSQIMRSKDTLAKWATNFMAEPTKTYNMLREAAVDLAQGKKGARAKFARTFATFTVTALATAAGAGLIDALRSAPDKPEEDYAERYLDALAENFADNLNILNELPFVKDILSLAQGYDVSRNDMEATADTIDAASMWVKTFNGEGQATTYKLIYRTANALSEWTGLPVGGLVRELKSGYDMFTGMRDPLGLDEKIIKSSADLKKALAQGKNEHAQELFQELVQKKVDGGKDADEAVNSVKSAVTGEMKPRFMEGDSAERDAVKQALLDLTYTGHGGQKLHAYDESDFNTWLNSEDRPAWTEAMQNCDLTATQKLTNTLMERKMAEGKTADEAAKSLRSTVTSTMKPLYVKGTSAERRRIENMLLHLKFGGKVIYDQKDLDNWLKK